MRGVAMVLDGLATSIERAQRALRNALDLAADYGFTVDEQTGAMTPSGKGTIPEGRRYGAEVEALLGEALREADQADRQAAAELRRLTGATTVSDPEKALNDWQGEASQVELNMYAGDIPSGKDPVLVAHWWDSLTPRQQEQLKLSDPVVLADLNGIPDGVKRELRGTDGKYDRVEMVRWTMEHWNDSGVDIDGENNCTNFASEGAASLRCAVQGLEHLRRRRLGEERSWRRGLGLVGPQRPHPHRLLGRCTEPMNDFLPATGAMRFPPRRPSPATSFSLRRTPTRTPRSKRAPSTTPPSSPR